MKQSFRPARLVAAALAGAALVGGLGACAPLIVGAAAGGALVATDRRTSGVVVDDQGFEIKALPRIREVVGERGHVNVTSYNRVLLLTGEVPAEADKAAIEAKLAGMENVKGVLNELVVGPNSTLGDRSNDTLITSKVKASYVDARDLFANAFKVVTERGVVYLMGRVTEREATRAVDIARGVAGVRKVVRAFEVISEEELARTVPAKS
ncbi:MAG TPA: BON domain-containing protein [Methylibium sp.]|nr:BON domain-containing protein [Methylibium sp.]